MEKLHTQLKNYKLLLIVFRQILAILKNVSNKCRKSGLFPVLYVLLKTFLYAEPCIKT